MSYEKVRPIYVMSAVTQYDALVSLKAGGSLATPGQECFKTKYVLF